MEEVELLGADEALPARFFAAARRQFRRGIQPLECGLDPFMNPPIALTSREFIPPMARRKNDTISPVRIVWDKPSAGWPANEWTQNGQLLDVSKSLKVAEGGGCFCPAVETQQRNGSSWRRFQ